MNGAGKGSYSNYAYASISRPDMSPPTISTSATDAINLTSETGTINSDSYRAINFLLVAIREHPLYLVITNIMVYLT